MRLVYGDSADMELKVFRNMESTESNSSSEGVAFSLFFEIINTAHHLKPITLPNLMQKSR